MRNLNIRFLVAAVLTLLAGGVVASCGGETKDPTVTPQLIVYDRTVASLTGLGNSKLEPMMLKGTYGPTCRVHAGETWDLIMNDPTDNSIEVVLNDTFANCPLTLTHIGVSINGSVTLTEFPVVPPILLGLGYAGDPSSVNQPSPSTLAFFTNAKIQGLAGPNYTNNFLISMVYSDQKLACDEKAPPAIYAKITAVGQGNPVPPPDYTMEFPNMQLVVDANLVVQSSSAGAVLLKFNQQPGEEWKGFDESTKCCTTYAFAEIDTIYKNFTPITRGTITGTENVTVPWTDLNLMGQTLPKSRTIIVKHLDGGGVYSYELFQVLFPGPL